MGSAFAFMAACAFALGTVLQQKGTLGTTSGSGDSHWLIQILRKPVWLTGLLLQASGWVLQAVALDKGPLMAVQAITTLSLVIALPFGAWLTHQHIDRKVVLGALAVVAGIVVFLSVGSPHGGTNHPGARTWWIACLVTLVLVLAMAGLGRKRQGAARALLFGAAAGFGFALQTAVTKDFVTEIGVARVPCHGCAVRPGNTRDYGHESISRIGNTLRSRITVRVRLCALTIHTRRLRLVWSNLSRRGLGPAGSSGNCPS